MAYDLVWEDNGVYWKYSGNVTGQEIIDASTSIYGDVRFITLKYKFVDFIDVEMIDSIGIGVIVAAYNTMNKEENVLKCVNLNDNIYTHFKFLRLDRHIFIEKRT